MKRFLAVALALLLAMLCTSCIRLKPGYGAEEPPTFPQIGDTDTEPSTDEDKILSPTTVFPSWNTVSENATRFLTDTKNAVVDCTKKEYTYLEMVKDLELLCEKYPKQLSYSSIGRSVAGREIYVAVLGNPDASRQILVSAGIHAREYLTPLLVMKQIEYMLAYLGTGNCNGVSYDDILQKYCFYIVPMSNPDGIMLSQEGLSTITDTALADSLISIYHKDFSAGLTTATNVNEYLKYWKANAVGTDLNRNFDALWEQYEAISRPSMFRYKGPSPNSEPETQALVALTERLPNIQAVLCIHSQGEVVYWNCGQSAALSTDTRAFAAMITGRTGYKLVAEQNNDASYSDWCALKKGLIAVTVETGNGVCPLEIEQFQKIWSDHFDLLLQSAVYFE